MPLDRSRTQEELCADLRVCVARGGETGDLGLLRSQVAARLVNALADRLAGGHQFAPCSIREGGGTEPSELLVGLAELIAGIDTTGLTTKPFAVEQPSTSKPEPCMRLAE